MPKAEWGTKRQCKSCGAKFYDLKRDPIECPKCGTVFEVVEPTRLAPVPDKVKKPQTKVVPALAEDDDLAIALDDDAEIDLGDDDADDSLIDDVDDDGADVTDVVIDVPAVDGEEIV